MDAALEHLREHHKLYAVIVLLSVPLTVFFRRYSVPAILYAIEFVMYAVLMHAVLGGTVRLAAWFRAESTMERALDSAASHPGWTTPFARFYDRALYNPPWLFYLEVAALVIIVILMFKYRPLRPQKKKAKPLSARALSRKMAARARKRRAPLFGRK